MQSTPASSASGDSPTAPRELPWAVLQRNLVIWLAALQTSVADGDAARVLGLLEGLVAFVSSNEGVFLNAITGAEEPDEGLKRLGAPEAFISTFMEVIRIAGGVQGPRIMTFGNTPALSPHATASVLRRFRAATSPGGSPRSVSPRATSPRSPRVFPRTTYDMLEDLRTAGGGTDATAAVAEVQSALLQLSRVSDAVVTPLKLLPPAIITALEDLTAAPFLFFRWLSTCLVEVLFCIYHPDSIVIVKRKIVYMGPKPGSQVEGPLMLPTLEEPVMLEGPFCLPWNEVAGLLEAPAAGGQ
eukprot:jgi/Ulvmu1/5049/UM021_0066.1